MSPVLARAVEPVAATRWEIEAPDRAEIEAAPVDHLVDIAYVMRRERRVLTPGPGARA